MSEQVKLERRIYSSWAFTDHEVEKARINLSIYNEIKDKAKVEYAGGGYAKRKFRVVENPHSLSTAQLALIADQGNLCFGFRMDGDLIVIHTD